MNNRNEIQNSNNISDYRVAPHASIDSQILTDRNSVDIFCDVSQEEWKGKNEKKKNDKTQISKMIEWFEEKRDYIKIHWKISLVICGVCLILIGLFITAALLLILLPKKNDSNNVSPSPEATSAIPESPHGYGRIKSMKLESYQFDGNISIINSIVIDEYQNLLIYADNQIILLNIENKTLLQSSFATEFKNCKVYNVLPKCFSDKVCKAESIFYCCEKCSNSVKAPFCWNYKNILQFDEGMVIKSGVFIHEKNIFQAEIIQINKDNCQIQMFTFFANSAAVFGELLKCTENSDFYVNENLIAAAAKINDTRFQWRANIDFYGTLKLYHFDNQIFFIYNFINSSRANNTTLKMKYDGINSFFVAAFSDQTFSVARITDDGINTQLKVLQPLPLKIDISSLGILIDWDFYSEELCLWYFDDNNNVIYDMRVIFEWES